MFRVFALPLLVNFPKALAQWPHSPPNGDHPDTNWDHSDPRHGSDPYDCGEHQFKHVISISVDGMHSSDLEKWINLAPQGNISKLLDTGYEYTNAWTSAPSDSFPGTLAQFTGATPRTTGVWYDVTYDRSLYAPGSNCTGLPGAEVAFDETIDYNSTELFSGGIDPANLPLRKNGQECQKVYPHQRPRVNTIFEVVHDQGYQTAYTDKHPAYDIVRGSKGTGLSVGYFPEIAATSTNVADTIAYDKLHVAAWLDWLDAKTPDHSEGSLTTVPALFGGNFQALSVAQKTVGYNNDSQSSLSPAIVQALTFIDSSVGLIVNKLKAKGLYDSTLIIVASKHGQAPINRGLYNKLAPSTITKLIGVPEAYQVSDDIALIFLNHTSDTAAAAANLNSHRAEGKIRSVIWGANLTASGFGNPATDPAVPDIIVQPELGTIYTTSIAKVAEHGGISSDDRWVTCFASNPKLRKQKVAEKVYTTQVGPTILRALGIDPTLLEGAVVEETRLLPGFV